MFETAPASDGTAYREYVLTAEGRGLFPVIVALRQWGEDFLFTEGEERSSLVDQDRNTNRTARYPIRRRSIPRLDRHAHDSLSI
ncbi:winged helix-turn-helix transcriptional regulator [Rhizobium sp. WCS2018Hpa-16]|uniref:winged helix-turn-helix transcriptional regulator n=1 Tax=unclassified Rhizobium TaxID=2613769 RepID=UPI0039049A39